ncbi:MFS transporter [Microbacterium sp.]|uniref:MFS transporter n=1 Tax=unclassified Microbacterium TaxID=2609290 RepID=UPI00351CF0CD
MHVTHRPPAPPPGDGSRRETAAVLGRFAPMIYGPTVLFAVGEGAVLPLLPVLAARLGADIAVAGLVASALVVGQLVGNLPAGWAVSRIGERLSMAIALGIALLGVAGALLAPNIGVLMASVLLIGLCAAVFGLARHSFMTTRVPLAYRARALSLLGGTFRLGMFVGPFIAAALLAIFGTEDAALWFFGICLVATALLVLLGPDPETRIAAEDARNTRTDASTPRTADDRAADPEGVDRATVDPEDTGEAVTGSIPVSERVGVLRTMWQNRGVLARLGLAAASLSSVRSARQLVMPLWGLSIGLDASTIALVVGISGAIDFALFYVSGQIMDRFGRLWAVLPSMVLMGGGFLALSVTHDLTGAAMWFAAFAMVLAVGNGLSSGILLTLGADVAPKSNPAPFLGSWRTLTDAGGAATPLLVSGITAVWSIGGAVALIGVVGLVGAAAFSRYVPRFVPRVR